MKHISKAADIKYNDTVLSVQRRISHLMLEIPHGSWNPQLSSIHSYH